MSQAARRLPADGEFAPVARSLVLDAEGMRRALTRMAHEVLERNGGEVVILAGIPTRGVPLAHRLAEMIREIGSRAEVLELVVDGHRDDRLPATGAGATDARRAMPAPGVADRVVVLVDDVIFHGRTARAALDALTELGRPRAVQLAVLVDRGHRELPIRADFVGKNIPTSPLDRVEVHVEEVDGSDVVLVIGERDG